MTLQEKEVKIKEIELELLKLKGHYYQLCTGNKELN